MLIPFLFGIIVIPAIVGTAVTPKLFSDRLVQLFLNYLIGFSMILCVYSLFFYYFLSREGSFWELSVCFVPALIIVTVISCLIIYFSDTGLLRRNWKQDADSRPDECTGYTIDGDYDKGRWVLFAAAALILFELFRSFFLKGFAYRDDRSYIPLINDILHTGILNGKQYVTGAYYTGMPYYSQGGYKLALSSWYAFEAWLAQASGLHPLLLCNRVLSVMTPLLYYMTMWILGCSIFSERRKQYWFLLFSCLLNLLWNIPPQQQILLVWPSWGKNLTAAVYVPLVMVLYNRYTCQTGRKRISMILLMMTSVLAGCAASAMGVFILPLELGIRSAIQFVREKQLRLIPEAAVMMIPAIALLASYYLFFLRKGY